MTNSMQQSKEASADVRSYRIDVPQSDLDDLRDRLKQSRWPVSLSDAGWQFGVSLSYVKELADYWEEIVGGQCFMPIPQLNYLESYLAEIRRDLLRLQGATLLKSDQH